MLQARLVCGAREVALSLVFESFDADVDEDHRERADGHQARRPRARTSASWMHVHPPGAS